MIHRNSHAALDLDTRVLKAKKIEALLGLPEQSSRLRLLEIGTGSGVIAHYFATNASLKFDVSAVDVCDHRIVRDGFEFLQVQSTQLPYCDASFDVVISNHVIEHVGDLSSQSHHLQEIRRVLRPDGVGYLAVPNRWMLVEPHYQLALLSWLPRSLRTPYLRLAGKGQVYDCEPLQSGQLERMLQSSGLEFQHMGFEAAKALQEIEGQAARLIRALEGIPLWTRAAIKPLLPTLVYLVRR
ncbi:class I SAM-dependent methyltransferase [Abyssibacter sp.]|uniref:class I SAM-dependent methyltransferase n=1 Tax=Abyssibacter sp. TaxID=2320200 RepID=UPI0035151D7D